MKKLYFLLSLLMVKGAFGQIFNGEGGFTGSPEILRTDNIIVEQNSLSRSGAYRIKIGFYNGSVVSKIPAHTMDIRVDLGSLLVLNDGFHPRFVSDNLPQFFDWYVNNENGNIVLLGRQKYGAAADIPALTATWLTFDVKPKGQGTSTVSAAVVVHNNGTEILNDPVSVNNSTAAVYTITSVLPVNFSGFRLEKSDCRIAATWQVDQEVNVDRYEVEASVNGRDWVSQAAVSANGSGSYSAQFSAGSELQSANLLVRVKNIDFDGSHSYSRTGKINSLCSESGKLAIYPNPVQAGSPVTITASGSVFRDRFRFDLLDGSGKLLQSLLIQGNGGSTIDLPLPRGLPAGSYIIRAANLTAQTTQFLQLIRS